MYNNELIRLVGMADPDTHADFAKSFDFYKKEAEAYPDFYEEQFNIERKTEKKGWDLYESTYYRGMLHSYMGEPGRIITRPGQDDSVRYEYYSYGKLNRIDAPAVIVMRNGKVEREEWWKDGELHREDGPAVEIFDIEYNNLESHTKRWYRDGKLHRTDGPAVVAGPLKEWWVDDKLHRIDGPAVMSQLVMEWWVNGKRHRVGGPAVLHANGLGEEWWVNNKQHRVDGPAVTKDGMMQWWIDGKRHRIDGPALIRTNKQVAWYYNGELHRVGGPAFVQKTSGILKFQWMFNGNHHRLDGPASVTYDLLTKSIVDEWYIMGFKFNPITKMPISTLDHMDAELVMRYSHYMPADVVQKFSKEKFDLYKLANAEIPTLSRKESLVYVDTTIEPQKIYTISVTYPKFVETYKTTPFTTSTPITYDQTTEVFIAPIPELPDSNTFTSLALPTATKEISTPVVSSDIPIVNPISAPRSSVIPPPVFGSTLPTLSVIPQPAFAPKSPRSSVIPPPVFAPKSPRSQVIPQPVYGSTLPTLSVIPPPVFAPKSSVIPPPVFAPKSPTSSVIPPPVFAPRSQVIPPPVFGPKSSVIPLPTKR